MASQSHVIKTGKGQSLESGGSCKPGRTPRRARLLFILSIQLLGFILTSTARGTATLISITGEENEEEAASFPGATGWQS